MITSDAVAPAVAAPEQIRWMVTNLTKYRNDSKVRCQFFSNFADASYAFYTTVDCAIERVKDDFRGCNYGKAEELRDEFFTFTWLDSENDELVVHKSREFECTGVNVYLSEVHPGDDKCVILDNS